MTTAHRPTWKAAVGQSSEGGWSAGGASSGAVATLNLASHTKLKVRSGSQVVDRKKALRESLRKLQQAEDKHANHSIGQRPVNPAIEKEGDIKLLKQTADIDEEGIKTKYNDDDASDDDGSKGGDNWNDSDSGDDLDASDSDDDDDDSDDEEDDEAALQAELAKIRAERAAKKAEQDAEVAAEEESKLEEAAILGNPLLASEDGASSGRMKRRWNDDVVFRNQAKDEPEIKKRFINDTVRNDFHKRFMNKFIQ